MTWQLFTAAELADLRSQILGLQPDTAVIQESAYASDGAGGGTITWSAVTDGTVSCRIDSLRQTMVNVLTEAQQERFRVVYQATFPYDAPIAADRRVVINDITYEIVVMYDDHSQRLVRRAVLGELA